jgi:hypothetical protein
VSPRGEALLPLAGNFNLHLQLFCNLNSFKAKPWYLTYQGWHYKKAKQKSNTTHCGACTQYLQGQATPTLRHWTLKPLLMEELWPLCAGFETLKRCKLSSSLPFHKISLSYHICSFFHVCLICAVSKLFSYLFFLLKCLLKALSSTILHAKPVSLVTFQS